MTKIEKLCRASEDAEIKEAEVKRTVGRVQRQIDGYLSNMEEAIDDQKDTIRDIESNLASSPEDFNISTIDDALAIIRETEARMVDIKKYQSELFTETKSK
jgi:hypothetical protein